jgi:hypothetical protein
MPWDIKRNYGDCKGYAVVKRPDGSVAGCHVSRAAAEKQIAALYSSENMKRYKGKKKEEYKVSKNEDWLGKPLYDQLPDAEKALADSLISLAEKVGPLDEANGIWVGYVDGENNEDKNIGVKCGNCALIKSENACAILAMKIETEGNCRFAVIPPGYVDQGPSEDSMEMGKADSVRVGQMVSWNSSGGRAQGRVIRIVRNGKVKVPNTSFEITGTAEDPALVIRLYRDGEPTDVTVGHKMKTVRVMKSIEENEFQKASTIQELNLKPTQSMANNARRGLELRKKFGRGGTSVGVARARDLANKKDLSAETVLRMYSFFSRHEVDKKGKDFNNAERPSNGKIAWLLWGGDSGYSWAKSKRNAIVRIRSQKSNDAEWQESPFSFRKQLDTN